MVRVSLIDWVFQKRSWLVSSNNYLMRLDSNKWRLVWCGGEARHQQITEIITTALNVDRCCIDLLCTSTLPSISTYLRVYHLPTCITYVYLPTYLYNLYLPTYLYNLYLPTYLPTCITYTYLPTYLPVYPIPTYLPV